MLTPKEAEERATNLIGNAGVKHLKESGLIILDTKHHDAMIEEIEKLRESLVTIQDKYVAAIERDIRERDKVLCHAGQISIICTRAWPSYKRNTEVL